MNDDARSAAAPPVPHSTPPAPLDDEMPCDEEGDPRAVLLAAFRNTYNVVGYDKRRKTLRCVHRALEGESDWPVDTDAALRKAAIDEVGDLDRWCASAHSGGTVKLLGGILRDLARDAKRLEDESDPEAVRLVLALLYGSIEALREGEDRVARVPTTLMNEWTRNDRGCVSLPHEGLYIRVGDGKPILGVNFTTATSRSLRHSPEFARQTPQKLARPSSRRRATSTPAKTPTGSATEGRESGSRWTARGYSAAPMRST
jgi:hypothetical protein